jgi:hypothetical protein
LRHTATIETVTDEGSGVWTLGIRDVQLTMGFLIEPKVGDVLEVTRSPLIFSVDHKGVVLYAESRVPVGTKVYARDTYKMQDYLLPADEECVFVGTTRTQWEDSRGGVHDGIHRFLVEAPTPSGITTLEFHLLDVDTYWSLEGPLTGLDHILRNWDQALV